MNRSGWRMALLVGLACGGTLRAQFFVGPGFNIGGGFVSRKFAVRFGYRPPLYANPYIGPFGSRFINNTVLVYPPTVVVQQPIVVQVGPAPPVVPSEGLLSPDLLRRFLDGRPAVDAPPPPLPEPPDPPRALPRPPMPHPDPRREAARQIELGKEAFAAREYGRAAERFALAADADPNDGTPRLLLGQALLALGKYRPAFDAIGAGLDRRPDWPTTPFRPLDLYGPNLADYANHLAALEDALSTHPDDGLLLFLTAYALWFDGRRAEARPLFERAAPVLPDRTVVERFLRALPGGPVV
jgi:hypothetical protein